MQIVACRPWRTPVLSAVLCFALTPTLLAQSGQITGTVYDDLALPADGQNVELYRGDGEHLDSTATGGGGHYAFTFLADDYYLVRVTSDPANGLLGEYYDGVNEHDQDLATRITVSGSGTVAGVDFTLSTAGSISGALSGLLPGESIRLDVHDALTGRWRGSTDSDPVTYTIEGLGPGTYTLSASTEGTDRAVQWYDGHDRQSLADAIAVGAGEDVAGIDLTLTPGTSISGTVNLVPDPGDGGATVQQVRMDAMDASTFEWVVSLGPDASGDYSLANLPPGTYVVQAESSWLGYVREMWVSSGGPAYHFEDGEPIAVDAGSPATAIDFDLELGWTIEGHAFIDSDGDEIQDAGEPDVQWSGIQATQTDGSYWTGGGTDDSGNYSVFGLAPGTYELSIESSQVDVPFVAEKWDGRLWSGPGDPVFDVGADGLETGIDFSVVQDRVISGKVFLDADDDQVQDSGEPGFNSVTVRAYDVATGRHEGHAAFGPGGVYSLGVAAGVYRVEAQPHQGTLLREYWQDVFFSHQSTLVDVTSADAADVDFGLVDGAAYGTLRGRVVASVTGVPVPDVQVQVNPYETGEHGWSGTTGADGAFVVANLPPGSYSVYFETQGSNETHDTDYVASHWSSIGLSNDPDSTHHQIDYPAIYGDGTDLGDVEIEVGGSIAGTVTRATGGAPVEGFWIACEVRNDPSGRGFSLGAVTDSLGEYRVRGLLPGDYEVRTTGGVSGLANATHPDLVALASGAAATGIDFALVAGTSISGTVALSPDPSDGGASMQQIWVDAVDPVTHHHLTTGQVSTDGTYVIDNLEPGSYLVKVELSNLPYVRELWTPQAAVPGAPPTVDYSLATPVVATVATPANGIDFLLEEGRSISGHVFLDSLVENGVQDAGEPDVENAGIRADLLGGGFGDGMDTDAAGDFQLRGLVPGLYSVRVESADPALPFVAQVWDGRGFADPPDSVDVTLADVTGLDFAVVERRVISGQVFLDLDDDQVQDAGEPPFSNATIRVHDFATGTHLAHGWIGADGVYAVGVEAGVYRVDASPHQGGLLYEYFDDVYFQNDAAPVDVTSADASGVDFGLVDGSTYGTLRGRLVATGTGVPVPDVHVQVNRYETGEHGWSGTTGADGVFVVADLPPGSYSVYFETQGSNDIHDTDYVASHWSSAGLSNDPDPTHHRIDYPAVPGDGTDLDDVEIAVGGSIAGTVTRAADGTPVEGFGVSSHLRDDPSGRGFWFGAETDASGEYRFRGLLPGDYEVRTTGGVSGLANATHPGLEAVASGAAVTGIDFALVAGTSISGTVALSPDPGDGGASMQQIWIDAVDPVTHHHLTTGQVSTDGTYVIDNLEPGSYLVKVELSNLPYVRELWTDQAAVPGAPPTVDYNLATPVVADAATPATGIDFLLEEGRAISGHVFLDSLIENGIQDAGEPDVANANVQVGLDGGGFGQGMNTDASGDFHFQGLVPGLYSVRVESTDPALPFVAEVWDDRGFADSPDLVDVTLADVTGLDFAVVQRRVISGQVFLDLDDDQVQDAGEPPFSNATIRVHDFATGTHLAHGWIGADGVYAVGVEAGVYRVDASPHQGDLFYEYWNDVYLQEEATGVDVTSADAAGIDFGLVGTAYYGTLRGRVTGSGGIPGVDVQVQRFADGGHVASIVTDANGDFVLPDLAPGSYQVFFETSQTNADHGTNFVASYWSATGEPGILDPDLLRVDFPEVPGDGTDLGDFALATGGSISGQVFPPGGESLPAGLTVSPQSFESGGQHLPSATVDGSGLYHLRGLPAPATYRVQADAWGTDLVAVYYLTASESTFDHNTAAAVEVEPSTETGSVDLFLELGGEISGTVTGGGAPLAGIDVSAQLIDDPLGRGYWSGAQTDAAGYYTLTGLPAGDYRVRVDQRDSDWANETYPGLVAADPGVPATGIDFDLEAAGWIHGRVTQSDGSPVVNLRIEARVYDNNRFRSDGYTDANGDFRVGALPQGVDYRLRAATRDGNDPQFFNFIEEYWDGHYLQTQADRVSMPQDPGGEVVEISPFDFVLELGGAISGFVTDGTDGIQNVNVCAGDVGGLGFGNCDETDHNGFYFIRGLQPASYHVDANPWPQDFVYEIYDDTTDWNQATPVSVPAATGGSIPIVEHVDFVLAPAYRVSGTVTEADGVTPIADLNVWAEGIDVNGWEQTWTGPDGTYEIRGLPPGSYRVGMNTEGTDYIPQEQEVDLSAGHATGVDFALDLGAAISGRVYVDDDEDGEYDSGEERQDVYVEAYDFYDGEGKSAGTSDADGLYRLGGLSAGTYQVQINEGAHNLLRMSWNLAFDGDPATPVEIVADGGGALQDVTGIDFRAVQGYEIRGEVFFDVNGDGERQSASEPRLNNWWSVGAERLAGDGHWNWAWNEEDDTYVIHSVAPGEYRLLADAQQSPYASEFYKPPVGTHRYSEADVVEIVDADLTGIDFSFELGGGIAGTLRDRLTGETLANIDVWADAFDGDGNWGGATSDDQGNYLLNGLPAGDYRVQTWDNQGVYLTQTYDDVFYWEDGSPVAVLARSTPTDPLATPLDFHLDEGGALVGVVYDDGNGNGAPDEGEGVGGIWVTVEEFAEPHNYFDGATTEADGTFRVGGLPPGDVRAYVSTHPTDYLQVIWDGGDDYGSPDWNDAAPLTVTAGSDTAANFALELGGTIAGTVLGGDGEPIPDHWVNANDYDGGPFGNGGDILGDGTYTIRGLKAGDYRVQSCGPADCEFFDDQTDWNLADRVTVTAGVTTFDVDFVFPKVPWIVSGPTPAAGERGSTVADVSLVAENLAGGLCAWPAVPPCFEVAFGGSGLTLQGVSLDAPSGTLTFDLQIAADASLGLVNVSIVNRQLLEDSAATVTGAFEVKKAASGDVPAPSAERLYVADAASGTVRVYGVADNSLLGAIETIAHAEGVATSADGSHLYVSGSSRKLAVIDTRLGDVGEEVARIQLFGSFGGSRPLALGADYLYSVDRELENRVQVVDRATWEVREDLEITLDSALWGLYLDPAGRYLWVILRNANSIAVIDLQPASGSHEVLDPVPLPPGTQPNDLAFTPDGARAYLAARREIFAIDTALALSDPASAANSVWSAGSGNIDVTFHPASGKTLAFIDAGEGVGALDVSTGVPQLLATFPAGESPYFGGFRATPEKLYVYNADLYQLYVADVDSLVTGPAPSVVRFDARADGRGLLGPGRMSVAPTPASAPATAPVVTIAGGSPAVNGAPFQVTLSGDHFAADAMVALRGTQIQGAVTFNSTTGLTVDFPATTPTGDYLLAVTNPLSGGNESGLSATALEVRPPPAFAQSQTLYVTHYGMAGLSVFKPDGSVDTLETSQAYPAHVALTPDGRRGFVGHYDVSEWLDKPESLYDTTIVDLDPGSPAYLDTVGTVPWVFQAFTPMAVTPNLDNPNGVFAYAANRYMSDTVSVIDPVTLSEVDLDGNPATESIPWQHPYWWWMTWDTLPNYLAGINRIELDADVLDQSLVPTDVGLTPDGTLLYTANRAGSVSIVDVAETHSVVGTLTHGGNLGLLTYLEVAPAAVGGKVYVYVLGNDAAGNRSLFVFEADQLDDASAFVHQIVLPVQDEFPREMSVSGDGKTVYLTIRYQGVLLAMDVVPNRRGHYDSICVTDQGTVVTQDSLCSAVSEPIVGLHHPIHAAADGLLYVNNGFGEQIFVLDAGDYELITTLGDPDPTYLAVEPAAAVIKPVVTAVTPPTGSPDGGDSVVVTGANFQPGAVFYFGTELATGVVVDSNYTLRAVTPASTPPGTTGTVVVKVENLDGRTGLLQSGFTYQLDITPPVFTTPPFVASQVLVGAPGAETVTAEVRWQTDEASTSFVDYRETGAPDFLQAGDGALVTDHLVVLTDLAPGTDHELRATSADVHGNAASSPEAPATEPFTTLTAPDTTAPVITSGPAVTPGIDSALVQWETHEPASSLVHYDAQIGDGQLDRQVSGGGGALQHSVTLTGLVANTEYEYKVLSVDASGNGPTSSVVATFTTDALPDATPPVITAGPEPSYLAQDLVILVWDTDEPSTSFVNYGVSSVLEQGVIDVDLVTTHVVFLTNLLPGTAYGYQAGSTDASGNTVLTADPFAAASSLVLGTQFLAADLAVGRATLAAGTLLSTKAAADGFTTPEAPDVDPPVATVTATALSHDRARVTAESDEAASLRVRSGVAGLLETAFDPAFSASPSLILAGLAANTTYQLEAELRDPKGNPTVVSLSFTTPAAPDTAPPVLSALATGPVGETTARITWQTDEPADATVRFGPQGGALSGQTGRLGLKTSHEVLLTGLEAGTVYAFEVSSRDASGNAGSTAGSFTTATPPPRITSVTPARAAQGTTVEVAINGTAFGAASQVDLGGGVTVSSLTVNAAGSQIRAILSVDPAAAVGPRQLTVTTPAGSASAAFAIVDQTVPVVTLDTPGPGEELQSVTVGVQGTLSELAAVTVNGVEATVSAGAEIAYAATVTLPGAGPQGITATAVDASGNRGSASVVVTVVNQPPVAVCEEVVVVALGPDCTVAASIDAGSYDPDDESFTVTQEPAGPFGPGEHAVTLTVEDSNGASDTCSATVVAHFDFVGFLPPIGGADDTGGSYGDPVRTFNRNSTIPVKFTLSCAGNPYLEGVHTLQTVQWSDDVTADEPIDATPQDAATAGNEFRLEDGEWHFNLDVKGTGMGKGQWQLVATLSDSTQHVVWIQVK